MGCRICALARARAPNGRAWSRGSLDFARAVWFIFSYNDHHPRPTAKHGGGLHERNSPAAAAVDQIMDLEVVDKDSDAAAPRQIECLHHHPNPSALNLCRPVLFQVARACCVADRSIASSSSRAAGRQPEILIPI